ncbi:unnamed protein product [Rotaria magnacalcarata]|uniref:Enoyl reductase (ER) domain-containing protein n=2 Tax=Rotaria TaxID=231623 RepID=A0A816VM47_9BILA|nr:unnamed protein product [Rotaria magnacalcarata]CAF1636696.1 unnamed protein product [Rotaria magnacalcarata]CAF2075604.1 unnamed protein product [Rotaria magnacalcarata]CAF2125449.1 unnamed protein product [Rotaria magnacalcarata]CAF2232426.1 unnamed protein product [Rotaria magnacalcarata]
MTSNDNMTNTNTSVDIKCIIVQQTFTGKRELKVTTAPKPPPPGDGEVLIAVKACGINFNDVLVRYGLLEESPRPPFIPGFECSGEILDIGTNVTHLDRGDRVLVLTRFSAWAEQIVVKKDFVFKIPKEMTFREAAVLPIAYLTAYILLFEIGNIKPGQTLLFHSAGGGVGVALTQLSKLVPNLTIMATASPHKFDVLRAHIHYLFEHDIDYTEDIRKITPEGIDLVLDCMAGDDCERGLDLLKFNGKYVMYGTSSLLSWDVKNLFGITKGMTNWWQNDKISCLRLFQDSKSIHGFNLIQLLQYGSNDTRRYLSDIMHKVFLLYKEGKIKPVVDSVFTFEDVNSALGKLIERKNIGKVVIEPFVNAKAEKVKKVKAGGASGHQDSSSTSGPDDDDEKDPEEVRRSPTSNQ